MGRLSARPATKKRPLAHHDSMISANRASFWILKVLTQELEDFHGSVTVDPFMSQGASSLEQSKPPASSTLLRRGRLNSSSDQTTAITLVPSNTAPVRNPTKP